MLLCLLPDTKKRPGFKEDGRAKLATLVEVQAVIDLTRFGH